MTNYLAQDLTDIVAELDKHSHFTSTAARSRLVALIERVAELGADPAETTTELVANFVGLEPDQEIRARALEIAVAWVGHHWVGGTKDRSGILAVADELARYIRDGSKP